MNLQKYFASGKKNIVNLTNSPSEKIALARKIKKPEKLKGFLIFFKEKYLEYLFQNTVFN